MLSLHSYLSQQPLSAIGSMGSIQMKILSYSENKLWNSPVVNWQAARSPDRTVAPIEKDRVGAE